jgi:hypothetical protein
MNSKKNHAPDISYFRLSLMDFLRESHPERLKDNRFILACVDAATEAYEQGKAQGNGSGASRFTACKILVCAPSNLSTQQEDSPIVSK